MLQSRELRYGIILALGLIVAAGSWLVARAVSEDDGPDRQGGYRDLAAIRICIEGTAPGREIDDLAAGLRQVLQTRRDDPADEWSELPPASVQPGCPGGPVAASDARGIERQVAERPDLLLQLYVGNDVPGESFKVPAAVVCQGDHNCGEVASALFVSPGLAADAERLGDVAEDALGINLPRHPNEPPAPGETKQVEPTRTPSASVDDALWMMGSCVVAEDPGRPELASAMAALGDALLAEIGDQAEVTSDCALEYIPPPGDLDPMRPLLPAEDAVQSVGVRIMIPNEWPFGFSETFRRVMVTGNCQSGSCAETQAGVYINPGVLDSPNALREGFRSDVLQR